MLLRSPELIKSSFPKLYNKFNKLNRQNLKGIFENVPCSWIPDRDTALEWIEIKHGANLNGVGLEKWDSDASARFLERRGSYRRWRIALKKLEEAGSVHFVKINAGIRSKTTAVERVLSAKAIKDSLKMEFKNNKGALDFNGISEGLGVKVLEEIMLAMAAPEFNTATVHSLKDRNIFIYKFEYLLGANDEGKGPRIAEAANISIDNDRDASTSGSNFPSSLDVTVESDAGQKKTSHDEKSGKNMVSESSSNSEKGKRPLKDSLDRIYLAPANKGLTYHIPDPAINKIYHEARRLNVEGYERVSGIMTRVFLELSCDFYLEEKNVPMPDHFERKRITKWSDAKLKEKVAKVIEALDPKGRDGGLNQVKKALGSDDWLHSIGTLHSFVHDRLGNATSKEIKTIWDRFHPLFSRIYKDMEK
ncbi:hypothetical protein R5R73_13835 [Salinicola sp. LHM]|uniref:hypothetical protein n=1 Tax=Salinicola sp. LHM TaxID=3065298 RepID=UPI002ACE43CB|nr:hypothetical protein [Salinicola sp. LHM]WQH32113.1 hypothetical protein R5R73_13835 [Salinicola sp. LHM]